MTAHKSPDYAIKQYVVDMDKLAQNRVDPKAFFDRIQARTDATIAREHERQMRYFMEPVVFVKPPPDVRISHLPRETGAAVVRVPKGPLDVEYDGVTLRQLLSHDEMWRKEGWPDAWVAKGYNKPTPIQRAAISAHWSAELRAKVAASKERNRHQVTMEHDDE